MPPEQCPACARFLKVAFVAGLGTQPKPCPNCDEDLTAAMFADDPTPSTAPGDPHASVRPPDLPPETVRDTSGDVLVGWDLGVSAREVAGWREDRRPRPVDTWVIVGGAASGLALGAVLDRRRARGAALGVLAGTVVAGVVRRIWRLKD